MISAIKGWFKRFLYAVTEWEDHHGVRIATDLLDDSERDSARTKLIAGLDVVRSVAPAQFARMQNLFGGIVVSPIMSGALASWHDDLRACLVDKLWLQDSGTTPEAVAATLIHELAHARLDKAGFPYDDATRARIERICSLAQRNFILRMPPSASRTELEEINERYLGIEAAYWTQAAIDARMSRVSPSWSTLHKVLFQIGRAIRSLRNLRGAT